MAVVIVLMSMMLTLGIAALSVQQDHAAISATQRKQEVIKDALIAYLRVNRRLPCPETTGLTNTLSPPTGRETRSTDKVVTTICGSYVGTLPWLDLGLAKEATLDGYDNFFSYYVASAASTNDPDWTLTAVAGSVPGFSVGNPGRFAVTESGQDVVPDANSSPVPPLAVAVLVSHGKNGLGAVTEKGTRIDPPTDACEVANNPAYAAAMPGNWLDAHADPYTASTIAKPAIVKRLYAGTAPSSCSSYDDIVLVLRPNDLLTPIIKDGAMKSPQSQLNESIGKIKTALAAYALATPNGTIGGSGCSTTPGSVPYCRLLPAASGGALPLASLTSYGLQAVDTVDLWGKQIRYEPSSTDLTSPGGSHGLSNSFPFSPPSSVNAYTLISDGPDRTSGTSDDITVTVTLIELRQMIGTANLP